VQRFLRIYTSTLSVYYNEMSLVIVQRPLMCPRDSLRPCQIGIMLSARVRVGLRVQVKSNKKKRW